MNIETQQRLKALFNPRLIIIYFLRKLPLSFLFRLRAEIDAINRPYYGYGLLQAAEQAKALGIDKISAIEFGVAAGHGLIVMERLAEQVTKVTGVKIDVYGFDLGIGLPTPSDYRDLPYIWQKDFYKMDVKALTEKLKPTTKLIMGNVSETVREFLNKDIAPIGFIAFDLDYYTSTIDAFKIFNFNYAKLLPRIFCYFDDVVGTDEEILNEYVGELLAIKEFNQQHENKKMSIIEGLSHKRVIPATWNDMVYVLHSFDHPKYNTYIYHKKDRQSVLQVPIF